MSSPAPAHLPTAVLSSPFPSRQLRRPPGLLSALPHVTSDWNLVSGSLWCGGLPERAPTPLRGSPCLGFAAVTSRSPSGFNRGGMALSPPLPHRRLLLASTVTGQDPEPTSRSPVAREVGPRWARDDVVYWTSGTPLCRKEGGLLVCLRTGLGSPSSGLGGGGTDREKCRQGRGLQEPASSFGGFGEPCHPPRVGGHPGLRIPKPECGLTSQH